MPAAHELSHQLPGGLVAHLPMTGQHSFRAGDAKSPAQRHHAFADFHFAAPGVTGAQNDEFRSLQVEQRSLQASEQTVFSHDIGDFLSVVRARERNAAAYHGVFPSVFWWNKAPATTPRVRKGQFLEGTGVLELLVAEKETVRSQVQDS